MINRGFVFLFPVALAIACGSADDEHPKGDTGAVTFDTTVRAFEGSNVDTGLQPKGSPAQVALAVRASGDLAIHGEADVANGKLVGRPGSGKLASNAGFALEGTMKLASGQFQYEGPLPGLEKTTLPLVGEATFDPFLVGTSKELVVKVPADVELPPIPIGALPAKLKLTITKASEVHFAFAGTCLAIAGGTPSWRGEVRPSGTLVVKGIVEFDVKAIPPIPIADIPIPIALPAKALALAGSGALSLPDATEGDCRATPKDPAADADAGADAATMPPGDGGSSGSSGGDPTCPLQKPCPGNPLGTIRGDIGNDAKTITGVGSMLQWIHVDEGSKDSLPLGVKVELLDTSSAKVKLRLQRMTNATTCIANVIDGTPNASTTWADKEDNEDARDYAIEVVVKDNACVAWAFTVSRAP